MWHFACCPWRNRAASEPSQLTAKEELEKVVRTPCRSHDWEQHMGLSKSPMKREVVGTNPQASGTRGTPDDLPQIPQLV